MLTRRNQQSGFTLVEMIMVMVITGIIGGMVAIFIQAPVQGYMDSARRAELTDIADTAMRRMARDVRTAVPNSVRNNYNCASGKPCFEFIATKDGGRYLASTTGGAGNSLTTSSLKFDVLGTPVSVATGDFIVAGSTQSNTTLNDNSPYNEGSTGVLRTYTSTGSNLGNQTINFGSVFPYAALLTTQRFDVVDGTQQAVTYVCETDTNPAPGDGPLKLVRHWHYWSGGGAAHPAYSANGSSAILATKISSCSISYDVANQRFGLLTVLLTLTSNNESISLYNDIHGNNAP